MDHVVARIARLLLTALVCGLFAAASASGATFTVNTTDDLNAGQCLTTCSLRDAIALASSSPDPEDTVVVPGGTYTLSLGELSPSGPELTIRGAGARTTIIDAAGASRVFNVGTFVATIQDLTITGGLTQLADGGRGFPADGGGILAMGGELTLERVAVVGNTAQLNGGGIAAPPENDPAAHVTIRDSLVAQNQVTGGAGEGQGGGIYVSGALTVLNSTVTGNAATNPGINRGGGIAAMVSTSSRATTVSLTNTTIARNTVDGVLPGSFGGGFASEGIASEIPVSLTATNTIIAGNTVGDSVQDCAFTNTTAGSENNLSSDATCEFTDEGSLPGTDPLLGPLADNGGDTDTLALLGASPAIDAGIAAGCPAADQRGVDRPQGPACDIGAFERVSAADLSLTKTAPASVTAGATIAYALTATNAGPDTATGVQITDTLPAQTTLASAAGATCAGAPLVCTLPDLAPGASATVTLTVTTAQPGELTNTATVTGSRTDPDTANNSASATTQVVAGAVAPEPDVPASAADLVLRQSGSSKRLKTGAPVVFSVRVRNAGPDAATATVVRVQLSKRLRLRSARFAQSGCARTGNVVRCRVGRLGSGRTATIRVSATGRRAGRAISRASVRAAQADPRTANNGATTRVTVVRRPVVAPDFTG
jgi:uncharacterized repeat protein (TIGR01451 family)/CSLREA domain-containing protein